MSSFVCTDCGRNAESVCVCNFPLTLLCDEHRVLHPEPTHHHLPPQSSLCIRSEDAQMELNHRFTKLHQLYSRIQAHSIAGQLEEDALDILLVQFESDARELKSRVEGLKAEVDLQECTNGHAPSAMSDSLASVIWSRKEDEGELGTWLSIGRALTLRNECRFQESGSVLAARWTEVHCFGQREVLVLGLTLGEVMGLRIGDFAQAVLILDKCLQLASELSSAPEVTFHLMNKKAAVLLNFLEYRECQAVCKQTIHFFGEIVRDDLLHGTALYYYLFTAIHVSGPLPKSELLEKEFLKRNETSYSLLELIKLCITAFLKRDNKYDRADFYIEKAAQMATQHFPTSFNTALCLMLKAKILNSLGGEERGRSFPLGQEAMECLETHFPGSLLRGVLFEQNAEWFKDMGSRKEYELRLKAHHVYKANQANTFYLFNLSELLCSEAFLSLKKVEPLPSVQSVLCRSALSCHRKLSLLADLYCRMHSVNEGAMVYAKALTFYQATNPTHSDFFQLLDSFCNYGGPSRTESELKIIVEVYIFLRNNYPNETNYMKAVESLATLYKEMKQKEKAVEIYLEGIQIAQKYRIIEYYLRFINNLSQFPDTFSKEKELEIRLDAHRFLVSISNPMCYNNMTVLSRLLAKQPEKLIEIHQETLEIGQLHPTSNEYSEILYYISHYSPRENRVRKNIEMRLQAHEVLKPHHTCSLFHDNARAIEGLDPNRGPELWQEVYRLKQNEPTNMTIFDSIFYYLLPSARASGRVDLIEELLSTAAWRLGCIRESGSYCDTVSQFSNAYLDIGQVETAIQFRRDHLCPLETSPDNFCRGVCDLAFMYEQKGRREEAVKLYEDTINTSREHNYYRIFEKCLFGLCCNLEKLRRREAEIEWRLEAFIALKNKIKLNRYRPNSFRLAALYEKTDDIKKAIQIYLHQLSYMLPFVTSDITSELMGAGRCYLALGSHDKAEVLIRRCFRLSETPLSERRHSPTRYYSRVDEYCCNLRKIYSPKE